MGSRGAKTLKTAAIATKKYTPAYKAKSGTGEFLFLPPNGTDGHGVFARDPAAWRTQVLQFMKANGFADLKEPEGSK